MQMLVSYWITAPLAKYVASFIVSPLILIDMTSVVLVQPINYFIVFPIISTISTTISSKISNILYYKPNYDESRYSLEPNYDNLRYDYEII